VLHALHELGVRLSLDDFGTGYSSLSYLRRFPIDKIKIDQSFIREMGDQPESIRIVRAIIALARSFGMKVIAEGVETEAQLRALREEHCDEIQGYLVSRALPQDRFLSFFENWQRGACDFASKCE
jgi:EAL domain-containing protein (putative c-di-GMP-specific phosphodiesterase class I)